MFFNCYLKSDRIKMKTGIWIIVIALVILAGVGIYLGTHMNSKNSPNNFIINTSNNENTNSSTPSVITPANPSTGPQTHDIEISGFAFNPKTLTINKGDTVTWTNTDSAGHNIKSDSGNVINSPLLGTGQMYSQTFTSTGTFAYHCGVHPSMKATIVVQ